MKARFKASFAKDLRSIGERAVLRRIREAIEQLERAMSLLKLLT